MAQEEEGFGRLQTGPQQQAEPWGMRGEEETGELGKPRSQGPREREAKKVALPK